MKTNEMAGRSGVPALPADRQGGRSINLVAGSMTAGILCLGTLALLAGSSPPAHAQESVAVAIVLDTSGSMLDPVRDTNGTSPKYIIARRAVEGIAEKLQRFATANPLRDLQVCAITFDNGKPSVKLPLGKFDAPKLKDVAQKMQPAGGTPLGSALTEASAVLAKSTAAKKHIFLITDGVNTIGPTPTAAWTDIKKRQPGQGLHVIAFDVQAAVFEPIKKLGATVVGAADAPQLNAQIDYILEKKILLEVEEPPAKK